MQTTLLLQGNFILLYLTEELKVNMDFMESKCCRIHGSCLTLVALQSKLNDNKKRPEPPSGIVAFQQRPGKQPEPHNAYPIHNAYSTEQGVPPVPDGLCKEVRHKPTGRSHGKARSPYPLIPLFPSLPHLPPSPCPRTPSPY